MFMTRFEKKRSQNHAVMIPFCLIASYIDRSRMQFRKTYVEMVRVINDTLRETVLGLFVLLLCFIFRFSCNEYKLLL